MSFAELQFAISVSHPASDADLITRSEVVDLRSQWMFINHIKVHFRYAKNQLRSRFSQPTIHYIHNQANSISNYHIM